jgi:CMP-N-acetylneuraminic acid synthetase
MIEGLIYFGRSADFIAGAPLEGNSAVMAGSQRYIDINVEDDWKRAEELYKEMAT